MTDHPLRALLSDREAAIAPMVAVLVASLLAAAGVALDVGLYYTDSRELRAATEAAALSAAQAGTSNTDIPADDAIARARNYLSHRGYDLEVLQSVQLGHYCANSDPALRFSTSTCGSTTAFGNSNINAVRITTTRPSRRFLTGILGGDALVPDLTSTATATRIDEAGIGITSDVLTKVLGGGPVSDALVATVNSVLGGLLGVTIHLGKSDIESLMRGNVDAGLFFDRLAEKENFTGTYGALVAGSHGLKNIAEAAAEATENAATAASLRLFAASASNSYRVPFSGLFGLGVWENMPVGEADAKPALRAGLNAYQLITFAAQSGPGVIDASDLLNLVMGSGNVLRISAIANGPGGEPSYAFGPASDAKVSTSKVRLQVELLSNIPLGLLELPLFVDIAPATASVTSIECAGKSNQALDTAVNVDGQSGLVNIYIGRPQAGAMSPSMPQITSIQPANILLGLATVTASAQIGEAFAGAGSAAFSRNPSIAPNRLGSPSDAGTAVTVRNQAATAALADNLISNLDVRVLGLDIGGILRARVISQLLAPIRSLLGSTADPLLDNVLAALGIQLGTASIWATGARCGVPVLI